jgi:hypothetical protein
VARQSSDGALGCRRSRRRRRHRGRATQSLPYRLSRTSKTASRFLWRYRSTGSTAWRSNAKSTRSAISALLAVSRLRDLNHLSGAAARTEPPGRARGVDRTLATAFLLIAVVESGINGPRNCLPETSVLPYEYRRRGLGGKDVRPASAPVRMTGVKDKGWQGVSQAPPDPGSGLPLAALGRGVGKRRLRHPWRTRWPPACGAANRSNLASLSVRRVGSANLATVPPSTPPPAARGAPTLKTLEDTAG